MQDVVTLLDLPSEIWTHILDGIVSNDATMIQSTNKRLFKLCNDKFGSTAPNDDTMCYFAAMGAISCLKYCHDIGIEWDEDTIIAAAKQGQLETIKFLHQNGCNKDTDIYGRACEEAAANNHFECLRYMHENEFPWDESATKAAVKANNLEILKYLHDNGCPWNPIILYFAACYSLDCLKYALENFESNQIEAYHNDLCSDAAEKANLETLKYLHKAGFLIGRSCERAASVGSLECLKFAHEHGGEWKDTILNAALGGHVECIRYALQNGDSSLDKPDHRHLNAAVESGNIECVELLFEHGAQWNGCEYDVAAKSNSLGMVRYLLEVVGRPKPTSNTACIIACGNIELLKYLHENGFSWVGSDLEEPSHTIVYQAVEYQSLPCLKYILECGYELDTNDLSLCIEAARHDDVEILKYLIGLGCKIDHSIMEFAAEVGALEAIKYLHKSGTDLNEDVATSAAKNGHHTVLEYVLKHGYGLNSNVCDQAAYKGFLKCLKVAHKYGVPFTAKTMGTASIFNYCRNYRNQFQCMKYLHEHGCEWTHHECTNIARAGEKLVALKYLHEHGSQWNEQTWYWVVYRDNVICLEYLFTNGCPQDPRTFDMKDQEKCYAFMQQHNIVPNTKDDNSNEKHSEFQSKNNSCCNIS